MVGFITKEEKLLRERMARGMSFHRDIERRVKRIEETNSLVEMHLRDDLKDLKEYDALFEKKDFDISHRVNNPCESAIYYAKNAQNSPR